MHAPLEPSAQPSTAAVRTSEVGAAPPWYLTASPMTTLPWLLRARWVTVGASVVALLASVFLPGTSMPLREIWPFLAAAALGNAVLAVRLRHGQAPSWLIILALAADMLLLTGLLELTGGPFNPFIVVYAVHVTLAALTVGRGAGGLFAILAVACLGALTYWHVQELDAGHHRLTDFPTHLFTLWVAVAALAELGGYFVVQSSNALARRERELEAMRQQAARAERVVSLTTLAAGAAHELSTPLATIALAARELEHAIAKQPPGADLLSDAQLIRSEVDRCRSILDQMSGRAGGVTADNPEPFELGALIRDLIARAPESVARRIELRLPAQPLPVELPRAGLAQAIQSLMTNALDASPPDAPPIIVEARAHADRFIVTVRDRGAGMTAAVLQRVGEPFFTTKEPGRGLGMGLFLARVFAERCGGALTLQSEEGTVARLDLPRTMPAPYGR